MLRFIQHGANTRWQLFLICLVSSLLIPLHLIEGSQDRPTTDDSLEVSFSVPSGTYDQDFSLNLSAPQPGIAILFTTDGSMPTPSNSAEFTDPLYLSVEPEGVAVVRARAVLPGGELGPVTSASYFLGVESALPMIALVIDPEELWDADTGIFAQPRERGLAWERPAEVFFVDQDGNSDFHIPAGLRVHGGNSRQQAKKPFRLYFRSEYGNPRLDYALFPQGEVDSFKRLILHAGGNEYPYANSNGTLLRNPLITDLSTEINGYASYNRPALLFINGQLWGIYYIREFLNRFYWSDHYGVEFLTGYGDQFNDLIATIRTDNLHNPENYAYLQTQLDFDNFIDYNIVEFYGANVEWPHFNQLRFRPRSQAGRWHWVFWDEDLVFGLAPNVSVNYDMVRWIFVEDSGDVRSNAVLLRTLMEVPQFRGRFLSRLADLLNSSLAPETMIARIDRLAAALEPDILYETRRWPSSSRWQTSVEGLRQFARLRPDILRQHFVDVFDLGGTVQLTIEEPDEGAGSVAISDRPVEGLPWGGEFFQGVPVRITAVPRSGYRFAGWDAPDLPQTPVISVTLDAPRTITPLFAAVEPDAPQPGDVVISQSGIDSEGEIEGDWIELTVTRSGGVDMRGWRITDNDTKSATDEGSLILGQESAFAAVPQGCSILIVATETIQNDRRFTHDDVDSLDRRMVLYAGNDNLDDDTDPWFNLGPNDNVALLAPGATAAFADDLGMAFLSVGRSASPGNTVTPGSFGILQDGVSDGSR